MEKELNDLFFIQCKTCGSPEVIIYSSGYGGEITVACSECDIEIDV